MPRARSVGLLFVGVVSAVGRMQHRDPARSVGDPGGPGRVRRHVRAAGVLRRAGDQDVAAAARGQRAGPGRGERRARRVRGGKERFAFDNDFQLKHLRRVLNENWRRLPESVATADKIEIEVKWSEKAGAKRVDHRRGGRDGRSAPETFSLPYHVCLSELLYGEPLYRQRRVMWGLPLPGMPAKAAAATDGGAAAPDGAHVRRRQAGRGAPVGPLSALRFDGRGGASGPATSRSEREVRQRSRTAAVQGRRRAARRPPGTDRTGSGRGAAARPRRRPRPPAARPEQDRDADQRRPRAARRTATNSSARQPSSAPMSASSLASPRPRPSRLST